MTYTDPDDRAEKPLVWLQVEIKTPPLSGPARVEMGFLLRRLQQGELLSMPSSRPMPSVGKRCHELRVVDQAVEWRLVYRIDDDAIVVLEVFRKKTPKTPGKAIELCKKRIRLYDSGD